MEAQVALMQMELFTRPCVQIVLALDLRIFQFFQMYHADILRDTVLETLPAGWRERLVSLPGCTAAHVLEPHDLAVVKLLVGHPKDISLLVHLHSAGLIEAEVVRARLDFLDIPVELVPRLHSNFRNVFGERK